jgi:hypothetical protein
MVGGKNGHLVKVPLSKVAKGSRQVSLDNPLINDARSLGTSFGDENESETETSNT